MSHELSRKLFEASDQMFVMAKEPYVTIDEKEAMVYARLFRYAGAEVLRLEKMRIAAAKENSDE